MKVRALSNLRRIISDAFFRVALKIDEYILRQGDFNGRLSSRDSKQQFTDAFNQASPEIQMWSKGHDIVFTAAEKSLSTYTVNSLLQIFDRGVESIIFEGKGGYSVRLFPHSIDVWLLQSGLLADQYRYRSFTTGNTIAPHKRNHFGGRPMSRPGQRLTIPPAATARPGEPPALTRQR